MIVTDIWYSSFVTRSETVRGEVRKPDWGGGHVDVEKACGNKRTKCYIGKGALLRASFFYAENLHSNRASLYMVYYG